MGGTPKDLGRSPYKICELDLSSLKASKNLEFHIEIPQSGWGMT